MSTIYEKTPGALIPSSERSVVTFESGLCRVDQRYTCVSDNASTHRDTLVIGAVMPDGDSAPSISGLYLFPSPQEVKRQDGFTDFVVSAYGRTTDTVQNIVLTQKRVGISRGSCGVWEVSGEICIPKSQRVTLEMLDMDDILFLPFDFLMEAYPGHQTLTVTEIQTVTPSYGVSSGLATVGGSSRTIDTIGTRIRYYSVELTADGSTVAATVTVWLSDPKIVVTSSRPFGEFVEITFQTERENTTAVIA